METLTGILYPAAIALLFAVCFGGLAFALLAALRESFQHYEEVYAEDAARRMEDMFLFIPPQKVLQLARTGALVVFLLFFFLFGDFGSPRGIIAGVIFGLLGGIGALNAPRVALRILRERRLIKFNEQLVEALVRMSNSLRAGFSIMQCFESVHREGQNPISQEFGVFLHQVRVGSRFEDGLADLERRVGSEDLTLTIRAIETARQTGGSLTEVFEKIAATIRERTRLQGRIRALTAQGRMQGIVVGALPILLLFVMSMIDPTMMNSFLGSIQGLGILGAVIVMEVCGFLVIRRIMRIDV
jgi:tight adherence protein B